MHAVTPRLYFQTLCQHEVFRVISTVNAGSLCTRDVTMATRSMFFFIFRKKGIKYRVAQKKVYAFDAL